MSGIPFEFEAPIHFFEKSDAPDGKRRRIAGVISTETRDKQDEVVLQRGLHFDDFLQSGYFNNDHGKLASDILGYPESVRQFQKGELLPDGSTAISNCTWSEGYLLENFKPADQIWELGQALQRTGRRLGFSIEGKVEKRTGADKKIIAKAHVQHVAITHKPVCPDARLEVLAKSLAALELSGADEDLDKALGMGTPTPGIKPVGPQTGGQAGKVLTPQSLEGQLRITASPPYKTKEKKKKKKQLNKAQATEWLRARLPSVSVQTVERIIEATLKLKSRGAL